MNKLSNNLILLIVSFFFVPFAFAQVSPLMSSEWNQGCYYNADCPADLAGPCGNVYTGCAATGLGQVMNYYEHPINGWGSHSYTDGSYGLQSADFSTANFNWTSMPNSLSSPNAEVAKLMYQLGVSVEMIYGPSISNSFFENPLKKYFKYSPKSHSELKITMSATEWENLLMSELDAGRVIYVKGGNHFYVIDGYQTSPLEFHCNFGWGGIYNGYYDIDNVNPASYNYTPTVALVNIEPLTELEVSIDTVYVGQSGGSALYEFSSLTAWTCASSQSWCTPDLMSGGEGYFNWTSGGSSTVTPNLTYSTRYADVTYHDGTVHKTIVVAQYGITPSLSVSSGVISESAGGGTHVASVNTDSIWTATPDQTWISVTPNTGTGTTSIDITIDPNPTSSTRFGNVVVDRGSLQEVIPISQTGVGVTWCTPTMTTPNSVGVDNVTFNTINRTSPIDEGYVLTTDTTEVFLGSTHTLDVSQLGFVAPAAWIDWNQDGDFNDPGEDVIDPAGSSYPSFGGIISVTVNVPLTAIPGLTRMRVFVKDFGTGPAYDPCATEAGGDIEDFHVIIKDPNYLDVDPLTLNYLATGGTQNVNVDSDSTWSATTGDSWLSVLPSTGTGTAVVGITATNNTNVSSRSGSVVFTRGSKTKTVSIFQNGADTLIDVNPNSVTLTSDGGFGDFDITSNVDYNIMSDQPWLVVSASTGSGNMNVDYSYTINPSGTARNAMIIVESGTYADTLFVTQDGTTTLSVTPLSLNFPWDGGSQTFDITTSSGWNLSTTGVWVSTDAISGSGNITITVTADTNFTGNVRTTYIDVTNGVSNEIVTVTQDSLLGAGLAHNEVSWSVFPNPAADALYINVEGNQAYSLTLFNLAGQVLINEFNSDNTVLNFSNLPEGIYVLKLTTEGYERRYKIVKQ